MRRSWVAFCCAIAVAGGAAPPPPKLAIVRATLHEQSEDGPTPRSSYEYIPGELLYLSFRAAGYVVKNDAVDLRWQSYVADPEGTLIVPIENGAVNDEVSRDDKDWLPKVQQTVALPPHLPGGAYTIHLRLADENAKSVAEATVPFRVRGRAIEKLTALTLRAVHFHRTGDDLVPLEPAVYAPGDTLWLRCEVAGFQTGKDNAYDVEYRFAIYRQFDKLLYEQPAAGEDHEAPFYPKRWLNGIFSVSLSQDVAPGEYRIVLKAHDKLADASAEQDAVFVVKK